VNLNHQSAFAPIHRCNPATMEAHGALGNGQTQPHAASLPASGVVQAIEGLE
jgi:hypothetical protein